MSFCTSCGQKLAENVAFCGNCGTNVGGSQPAAAPQQQSQPNYGQGQGFQQSHINPNSTQNPRYQNPQVGGYNQYQGGYREPRKEPVVALLLSFMFPGFGYAYIGDVGKAIVLFILISILYFVLIGFFIHLWVMFDSYNQTKLYNQKNGYPE